MLSVQGPLMGMVDGNAQFCCESAKKGTYIQVSLLKKNMILNCIALNETCFNGSHGTSIILDLIIFASNAVCILLNLRFCTFCKEKGKQTWGSLKWRKLILPHLKCYSSIIPHKFNLYHGLNHQLRKKQDSLLQYSERGNRGLIHNFFFLVLIHCSDVDVIWYLAKLSLISWKD